MSKKSIIHAKIPNVKVHIWVEENGGAYFGQERYALLYYIDELGSLKLAAEKMGPSAICPVCGEAYPVNHGDQCKNCNGESPYIEISTYKKTDICVK